MTTEALNPLPYIPRAYAALFTENQVLTQWFLAQPPTTRDLLKRLCSVREATKPVAQLLPDVSKTGVAEGSIPATVYASTLNGRPLHDQNFNGSTSARCYFLTVITDKSSAEVLEELKHRCHEAKSIIGRRCTMRAKCQLPDHYHVLVQYPKQLKRVLTFRRMFPRYSAFVTTAATQITDRVCFLANCDQDWLLHGVDKADLALIVQGQKTLSRRGRKAGVANKKSQLQQYDTLEALEVDLGAAEERHAKLQASGEESKELAYLEARINHLAAMADRWGTEEEAPVTPAATPTLPLPDDQPPVIPVLPVLAARVVTSAPPVSTISVAEAQRAVKDREAIVEALLQQEISLKAEARHILASVSNNRERLQPEQMERRQEIQDELDRLQGPSGQIIWAQRDAEDAAKKLKRSLAVPTTGRSRLEIVR